MPAALYRVCRRTYARLDGEGSRKVGGRWNSPGRAIVYMAQSVALGTWSIDQDTAASRHVAVINEAFARRFFKNENPTGKYFGRFDLGESRQYEIVGIAKTPGI